jgi:hypothetical protein
MIKAGVDVVRLNFSHGKAQDHIDRAELVRKVAAECGRQVAIMADLQGPKIRIGKFEHGKIFLENGSKFILDAACELGNQAIIRMDDRTQQNASLVEEAAHTAESLQAQADALLRSASIFKLNSLAAPAIFPDDATAWPEPAPEEQAPRIAAPDGHGMPSAKTRTVKTAPGHGAGGTKGVLCR